MPKVYAIQESPGKNLLPATDHGELKFILPSQTNLMFETEKAVVKIRATVEDFNEEDFLLLIGDPVCIGITTYYVGKKHDTINFLKWDKMGLKYFPLKVKLR